MERAMDISSQLHALGVASLPDGDLVARTPIDGSVTGQLQSHDPTGVRCVNGRATRRLVSCAARESGMGSNSAGGSATAAGAASRGGVPGDADARWRLPSVDVGGAPSATR